MSDLAATSRFFLRRPRRAPEVTLGSDGRLAPGDILARQAGDPEQMGEAGDIVEEARRHADEILRRAAVQAAAIERDARESGYRRGLEAGAAEARSELALALALVQRAAAASKATHDALLRGAEREAVELVIDAARQVIGDAVERDPALVVSVVRRALERAGALNVVRIRLHPQDVEVVQAALRESRGPAVAFEVIADGIVTVGGCIVDTEAGRIDARLDVQLEQIAQALLQATPVETPSAVAA